MSVFGDVDYFVDVISTLAMLLRSDVVDLRLFNIKPKKVLCTSTHAYFLVR